MSATLAQFAPNTLAHVVSVDWPALSETEARRLREFGLDDGVEVELLRAGGLLGGPLAVRIGRMTIALRRHVADAIEVAPARVERAAA